MSFIWLFDREDTWVFRVMIAKRQSLIWGCKEEKRENFMLFRGCINSIGD